MSLPFAPQRKFGERSSILIALVVVALGLALVTRISLSLYSALDAELTPWTGLLLLGRGLLFDLGFLFYALLPLALWLWICPQRLWQSRIHRFGLRGLIFLVLYGLGFLAVAEWLFWDEFQVRFNFIAVDYLIYTHEVTQNIYESYPLPWILGGLAVVTLGLYRFIGPSVQRALDSEDSLNVRSLALAAVVLGALVSYGLLDQELRRAVPNSYQRELASSGPYQFVAAFRNNEIDYDQLYAVENIQAVDAILRTELAEPNATFTSTRALDMRRNVLNTPEPHQLNVMLVMIESLSARYMARYGSKKGLTPRLDELANASLTFDQLYATGTRTTRGLEAVTLSLPPTPGRSIVKRLGREKGMCSLGRILNGQGYDTRFIYGGRGYFDNMNSFFAGNGYTVMDQSSTPAEEISFTTAWGMADEDLYRLASRAADEVHAEGEPFFFHLMTTSNHRPYTYPAGRVELPSGHSRDGAVQYTDWAIGDFIDRARSKPWFADTVFVFVADHCAGSAGKLDLPVERYHIPMFFYAPEHIEPEVINTLCSQVDLAPTMLALLGVSYTASFFGKDILAADPENGRALIGTYQHLGLYAGNELSILSPQRKTAQRTVDLQGRGTDKEHGVNVDFTRRNVAYYQGASYAWGNGLNAWSHMRAAEQ